MMSVIRGTALACALCAVWGASVAQADPIADFYKGKSMRIVIGYGEGGGYDLYARLAAEFMGRHIPGNPRILPQNMPGAGSLKAAKFVYAAAPKDGTVLGALSQTLPLEAALGVGAAEGIDATRFPHVGRFIPNIDLGIVFATTGIRSIEDARAKEVVVGASGGGSTSVILPQMLNEYGRTKFKIVKGYKGTTEILLAMERGEVQMVAALGLANLMIQYSSWLRDGKAVVLYQASVKRHPLLPDVPALPELATTDEGRQLLHLVASTAVVGRTILTTPGAPPERIAALRKAFQAMLADPAFQALVKQRNIVVEPATGEEMDAVARDTMKTPRPILDRAREIFRG